MPERPRLRAIICALPFLIACSYSLNISLQSLPGEIYVELHGQTPRHSAIFDRAKACGYAMHSREFNIWGVPGCCAEFSLVHRTRASEIFARECDKCFAAAAAAGRRSSSRGRDLAGGSSNFEPVLGTVAFTTVASNSYQTRRHGLRVSTAAAVGDITTCGWGSDS